jgi:large subunit ribosomal protein L21
MLTMSPTAALLIGAGALAAGIIIAFTHFHLRTRAGFVPLHAHRDEMAALRRRYRRRLRALRDAVLRHKDDEEQLRAELQVALKHNATDARLRAGAEADAQALRERLVAQDALLLERDQSLALANARVTSLEAGLREAQERIASFESEAGLMRIERDELVARTQRLRALPAVADTATPATGEEPRPAEGGASRADLAERNARIHELECRLRESEGRVSELESSLHTWKYRIAPLALHMKMQRDRARNARKPPAPRTADDLKRIHGIGPALERKMNAAGIRHFDQLADMSPAELANLATRIGVAATRPGRDRWAEQARAMATPAPPADPHASAG